MTLISELQMPFQSLIVMSLIEHTFIKISIVCRVVISVMEYTTMENERRSKLQELNTYPQTIHFIKSWRMFISYTNLYNIRHSAQRFGGT